MSYLTHGARRRRRAPFTFAGVLLSLLVLAIASWAVVIMLAVWLWRSVS